MQETLQDYPNLSIKAGSVADMILGPSEAKRPSSSSQRVYGEINGIRTGKLPHASRMKAQ